MSFGRKIESRTSSHSLGPQERISYHGDMKPFLDLVSSDYGLGKYKSHDVKQNGYEDFNLILQTLNSLVFVKCFASWRTEEGYLRYLDIIQDAKAGGVRTPALYKNQKGIFVDTVSLGGSEDNLCVMEYLDGGNIWESKNPITKIEQTEIVAQAAKINMTNSAPVFVKDSWAILNIGKKYEENKERISSSERPLIEHLIVQLQSVDIASLPQAFVHGDIRSTNVMRHSDGKLHIIDFSVANVYPRIIEFAVLCCDILFNPDKPADFYDTYKWELSEYAKAGIALTKEELAVLPLFVRLSHAMNVLGGSSVDATNFISKAETKHWLELGKKGLHFTTKNWLV